MKTGIITIHNSPNYGACLQSYALYKYVLSATGECEIIDLYRPFQSEFKIDDRYQPYRVKSNTPIGKLKKAIKKVLKLEPKLKPKPNVFLSTLAEERFNIFNAQINYSRPYTSIKELYENPPIFDVYITGSDQVWNPTQPYCLEPYFLTFAPKDAVKISYAPSIAIPNLLSNEQADFKKWLSEYDGISVREEEGKVLLESFINKEVTQVSDPTLLLGVEAWDEIAVNPAIDEPYILVFPLNHDQGMVDYAIKLSELIGVRIIFLKADKVTGYTVDNEAGPNEFLGYVKNAKIVITNSFHCTIFSILLGSENFYAYINPANNRGSRIVNLLETFSLKNHLLDISYEKTIEDLKTDIVNRDKVKAIIDIEQSKSRAFIDKWIK